MLKLEKFNIVYSLQHCLILKLFEVKTMKKSNDLFVLVIEVFCLCMKIAIYCTFDSYKKNFVLKLDVNET